VRSFQADDGLPETGRADVATLDALGFDTSASMCRDEGSGLMSRWARAEVDLDAIGHNVGVLRRCGARRRVGGREGRTATATAPSRSRGRRIAAGAEGLCVALVQEGVELREAGIDAPILVLTEQPVRPIDDLVAHGLTADGVLRAGTPTPWRSSGARARCRCTSRSTPGCSASA
jgi:hypothetical protein